VRKRIIWSTLATAAVVGTGCDFFLDVRLNSVDRTGVDPGSPTYAKESFVNWETPPVSPVALSADRSRLFVVNTPAARLDILRVTSNGLLYDGHIPVGLDPVSVRVLDDDTVWVVNHISDSVSILDLTSRNVVRTLAVGDEPTDVGFASGRAFVICSQLNRADVFDLSDPDEPPVTLEIAGEDPRAVAVGPDGKRVYVAVFDSGNRTTIIPDEIVSSPFGPYGGFNPPPNTRSGYAPPIEDLSVFPPAAGLIVQRHRNAPLWLDENGASWGFAIGWDVHDHDVAAIDAETLTVEYIQGLMNLNMHLAVRPDGVLSVVGTQALNLRRFEPNLTAKFVRSQVAFASISGQTAGMVLDLNPHLAEVYESETVTVPEAVRARSIADPRAIIWSSDGQTGYVSGMGSGNVAIIDANGNRLGEVDVGSGPCGLALDDLRGRLYVFNRFDASVSVVDVNSRNETERVALFDPTPKAIREGRPFLYDARRTSGLGVTACASCHIDGRMDQIAWDLGDPLGEVKPFDQECDPLLAIGPDPGCRDFHPVKGPMMTQTLQGIIGNEPLHWRGDRSSLADFNPAFVTLNGASAQLTEEQMAALERFIATMRFPPNPFRSMDNSLPTNLSGGNAKRGRDLFINEFFDVGNTDFDNKPLFSCNRCHQLPTGTNNRIIRGVNLDQPQGLKVPHLRNLYEKQGFSKSSDQSNRGFGFVHDGNVATLEEFVSLDAFDFGTGEAAEQKKRDIVAFLLALGSDTHAGVGRQVTLTGREGSGAHALTIIDKMIELAETGQVGLIVRGRWRDEPRGFAYLGGGLFATDRTGELVTAELLRSAATPGGELTWTLVPAGSEARLGIDRPDPTGQHPTHRSGSSLPKQNRR